MQKPVGMISHLYILSLQNKFFSDKLPKRKIIIPHEIWVNLWIVTTEIKFGAALWYLIEEINLVWAEAHISFQTFEMASCDAVTLLFTKHTFVSRLYHCFFVCRG